MKKLFFLSAIMFLLNLNVIAQTYTEIFEGGWGMGINYSAPAFSDPDHDGLLDLFVGCQRGGLRHYRQDAAGSTDFSLVSESFSGINMGDFATPAFIDLDNDGLLDMIMGNQSGNLDHFEQSEVNSLDFSLVNNRFNDIDLDYDSAPCFTDLDGDGILDMIVGERNGNLNHYEQDVAGSESFTLVDDTLSAIVAGNRARPAFVDIDDDGLLDLIVGVGSGALQHYEQEAPGSTTFVLITNFFSSIDVGRYSAPCFADFNEDGILDLLVGEQDGNVNHYRQDAAGSAAFTLMTEKFVNGLIDFGRNSAPAFADLDGDGLLDLIVGEYNYNLNHYRQDAAGSALFNPVTDNFNGIEVGMNLTPCFTDLDNDGLYDLIVGTNDGFLYHYEQDAAGSITFTHMPNTFDGIDVGSSSAPCFTDLDGDGLLDLIVGEFTGILYHYEQDGAGSASFSLVSDNFNGIDVGDAASPCFTDLDNDGLFDMLVNNNVSRLYHYEQDAAGSLSFSLVTDNFNQIYIPSGKPVFTDINGDGLEDLIMGDYYGGVHYFQREEDTGIEEDYVRHFSFKLFPNYPNPFNPNTTIRYDLLKPVKVDISVFNMLGQKVRVLENKYQQAGSYMIHWDGKDEQYYLLTSGIYICQIQAGEFKQSIKLMLLR